MSGFTFFTGKIGDLPEEHVLTLEINHIKTIKLICTNDALRELIYGFLYHEELINTVEDVEELLIDETHTHASVKLKFKPVDSLETVRPSGFGGEVLSVEQNFETTKSSEAVNVCKLKLFADMMAEKTPMYARTGGMHCSALFSDSEMVSLFEDIGRHNTLDKISGDCILKKNIPANAVLITTGRISSDMLKKAKRLNVSVIATYSKPTGNAYKMANNAQITLVGSIGYEKPIVYSVFCKEKVSRREDKFPQENILYRCTS